ncbi:MAG: methyltransferase domain-containing protein [Patescibacteria group bacterium]
MKETSWERSAEWYDEHLKKDDTYQRKVILPQLLRAMDIKKGEMILDLACGSGFFSMEFMKAGAHLVGVDASKTLIALAKKAVPQGQFYVGSSDKLSLIPNQSIDKVVVVLALQNIENVASTLKECARVLKPSGQTYIVLNHPAFRNPQESDWGWDESKKVQYRRIDRYLSESKVKIQMHPGDAPSEYTISFHRPLQFYFKALRTSGFLTRSVEEWESHKKSQTGPRSMAENRARKEIPVFLFLEAVKHPLSIYFLK